MSAPLKFCIRFLVAFAVLLEGFEATRGTAVERFIVEDAILAPTVVLLNLINTLFSGAHIALVGRTLAWGTTELNVTRGCEGVELFLLLAAAIFAFPATLMRRLQGLAVGSALAYCLSVVRLMILAATLRYEPGGWESMHGLIMPLAPVIALALYFLHWSGATGARRVLDAHAA
ncbi:MAG TPA: hypothetical protein VMU67_00470 [Steroidobacteraceae bacterium]|nr:hypothetical protein [Steroidobacteraceae bacterium]